MIGADHDAQGVCRNDVACRGFGDAEAGRNVGKQAHCDELRGADSESAQGEREHRQPAHGRIGSDDGDGTVRPIK